MKRAATVAAATVATDENEPEPLPSPQAQPHFERDPMLDQFVPATCCRCADAQNKKQEEHQHQVDEEEDRTRAMFRCKVVPSGYNVHEIFIIYRVLYFQTIYTAINLLHDPVHDVPLQLLTAGG
tara:strand:+ start:132 stop:503 length:372 start_codon:yes stop_codon:yes gene_type:complete